MAAKEKEYSRLRGAVHNGIAARSRLWLGKDHLLAVNSSGYSENYKRFYFRDIQAVIVRKTTTGRTVNQVLGPLAFVSLALTLTLSIANGFGDGASIFWFAISVLLLAVMLPNIIMGTTCICHVKTAVQTEELTPLRRLRRARRVLAQVRPYIVAAQGELKPGEIAARMAQPSQSGATTGTGASASENYIVPFDPPAT